MPKRGAPRTLRQLELAFRSRGGARRGAGRKPAGAKAGVSHARRPEFKARHPLHVTMKVGQGLPSLRHRALASLVFSAFRAAKQRLGAKLVHVSVQANHLHPHRRSGGTARAVARDVRPRSAPGPSIERADRASRTALPQQIPRARSTHTARGPAGPPVRPAKSRAPRTHRACAIHGSAIERQLLRRLQPSRSNKSQPRLSRCRTFHVAPTHRLAAPRIDRTRGAPFIGVPPATTPRHGGRVPEAVGHHSTVANGMKTATRAADLQ
jgi:hypothetical protein